MKRQDFNFELPSELIAQYPLAHRSDSRLLLYKCSTRACEHRQFSDICDLLEPGDLLVMNDSKVIPARLYGRKASGGKVEVFVERILGEDTFLALIKASKAPKSGGLIHLDNERTIEIIDKQDDLYQCKINGDIDAILHQIGHIPLPQYINRTDELLDLERYQTVYAEHKGSVAAPTAGLHFDEVVLARLKDKGINYAHVTLHVGAGTFRPVRCDDIKDHKMHYERFTVSETLCNAIKNTRAAGKRIIAVGTTSLRSLESAVIDGEIKPCSRETDIFIYPGYQFQICDGLITNFHLPESTLLMLVSAFVGYEPAMELYQTAITHGYRFFSYGDASLLLR